MPGVAGDLQVGVAQTGLLVTVTNVLVPLLGFFGPGAHPVLTAVENVPDPGSKHPIDAPGADHHVLRAAATRSPTAR
ncbi:hypothetical protein [Streptomyces sp. NPDC088707]|uniref:hypothetical protein n=1 Tax=Streptomyces sp. NPDC088707 TaxID=3365871 RepID=UPI00382590B6